MPDTGEPISEEGPAKVSFLSFRSIQIRAVAVKSSSCRSVGSATMTDVMDWRPCSKLRRAQTKSEHLHTILIVERRSIDGDGRSARSLDGLCASGLWYHSIVVASVDQSLLQSEVADVHN